MFTYTYESDKAIWADRLFGHVKELDGASLVRKGKGRLFINRRRVA